ncbi:MobA/MobL family protein [Hyphomicrobiales bacterium BP6-180914]|uniref:MobA/MobL family protein n=1 Tax=Lichenifustis flavocetrariae TaxID=2949735 RepID=A0AA42CN32_9HYPH|nr:MobA/MobL family protein [Lichenifustis flavocetrariae]
MRILELTAHVQHFSRAEGRSATAAAAYRACARIACERESRVHDYRGKAGLEATGIVLPAVAPAWASDRARLWNAAELRERNGARGTNAGAWKHEAMVAREILFGFPAELSPTGRVALVDRIARHLVDAHGVAVDWAIHAPGKMGDQRNHHCHMMFTTRRMTATGLAAKTREWNSREGGGRTVAAIRATLAAMMNEALAGEGVTTVHVEHRSLKARGIGRMPTKHMGPGKTNAGRKRQARERSAWERQHRHDQAARHDQERASQTRDRAARGVSRSRDIDQREAQAIEQARTTPETTTTQPQPGRLKRLVRAITGRADRQHEPTAPARVDLERDVRATYQAERERMTADHQRDAKALDDRHRSEDRQLDRAALARADRDRVQEVQERQGHSAGRDHDRTHARDEHERGHRP